MRGIIFFADSGFLFILRCLTRSERTGAIANKGGEDVPKLDDVADDHFWNLLMNIDKDNFKTFVLDSTFGISSLELWALSGSKLSEWEQDDCVTTTHNFCRDFFECEGESCIFSWRDLEIWGQSRTLILLIKIFVWENILLSLSLQFFFRKWGTKQTTWKALSSVGSELLIQFEIINQLIHFRINLNRNLQLRRLWFMSLIKVKSSSVKLITSQAAAAASTKNEKLIEAVGCLQRCDDK